MKKIFKKDIAVTVCTKMENLYDVMSIINEHIVTSKHWFTQTYVTDGMSFTAFETCLEIHELTEIFRKNITECGIHTIGNTIILYM